MQYFINSVRTIFHSFFLNEHSFKEIKKNESINSIKYTRQI